MELLPCPFCGKKLDLLNPDTIYPSGVYWIDDKLVGYHIYSKYREQGSNSCYVINCLPTIGGCGAEMHGDTKEETIAN